ncbi:MAG: octanoyltransferase [Legionellales bacterium]|nr:octanoyltransferase [Legionellales bacterium]|tara:strand:+ start:254 stop:913 length:660 start_codon:yes stop_codon:yes gene_type:complete
MQLKVLDFQSFQPYSASQDKMRNFALHRSSDEIDECWLLEHSPVFTLGQAADPGHILASSNIPVEKSDRGGQVTYHGPGLLMIYTLFDLNRHNLGVRDYVRALEAFIIDLLSNYQIEGHLKEGAPGVYVEGKKIASIGLRVRKGMSYHGTCLNVLGDLSPFSYINPCGYQGLQMTKISDIADVTIAEVKPVVIQYLLKHFQFTEHTQLTMCKTEEGMSL